MNNIKAIAGITIFSLLLVGCTIKGNPYVWSAKLADQMNIKAPHTQEFNFGDVKAKIVVYKARNTGRTIEYYATTNVFNSLKAEVEDKESMKESNRMICNSYPSSQLISKGLKIFYNIKETKESDDEVNLLFNKEECEKYGY